MAQQHAVFIGYRRDDTADVAGRIYDAFVHRFGAKRIFKDVDSIKPGADFGAYIKTVLPRCRVFLVLIGPSWLNSHDAAGARRIDNPQDWVRLEIETALATPNVEVVPVLINGASMPQASDLPASIRALVTRNAAVIRRDPDFHDDVARLAAALEKSIRSGVIDLNWSGPYQRHKRGGGGLAVAAAAALVLGLGGAGAYVAWPQQIAAILGGGYAPSGDAEAGDDAAPNEATETSLVIRPDLPALRSLQSFQACDDCPVVIALPGGTFRMGSSRNAEGARTDQMPERTVAVPAFALGKYEVTFDEWQVCQMEGPCGDRLPEDGGFGVGQRPVMNITWRDAQTYVQWLSAKTGLPYRLPTEAEWEFAASEGGRLSPHYWSNAADNPCTYGNQYDQRGRDRFGWQRAYLQCDDGYDGTAPVGQYPANGWGLHDLYGNISEWVQDCYLPSYQDAPMDGSAVETADCEQRVVRGGSWWGRPDWVRVAERDKDRVDYGDRGMGFRVALSIEPGTNAAP